MKGKRWLLWTCGAFALLASLVMGGIAGARLAPDLSNEPAVLLSGASQSTTLSTSTATPTGKCCGAASVSASLSCAGARYDYAHLLSNQCDVAVPVTVSVELQSGYSPNGWWEHVATQTYTQSFQPGYNYLTGTFVIAVGTPGSNFPWMRTYLAATSPDWCVPLTSTTEAIFHCLLTPSPTPPRGSPTPTFTYTSTVSPSPTCEGVTWRIVNSPNPSSQPATLTDVAAIGPNDAWAVGFVGVASSTDTQGISMQWDGTQWNIVTLNRAYSVLNSVTALGPNEVWAVGHYWTGTTDRPWIVRWNGSLWVDVTIPYPGTGDLTISAVDAVSQSDIWAVGHYWAGSGNPYRTLTYHWDGTAWSIVPSPNPGPSHAYLYGLTAISSNDVWAIGSYNNSITGFSMHWDGSVWAIVSLAAYRAIDGVASNDVWAIGGESIYHWSGAQWNWVPSNAPSGAVFRDVDALTPDDAWVVGYQRGSITQTLTLHWDGLQWGMVPSPNAGTTSDVLYGVSALASAEVWAVGNYLSGTTRTLTERYGRFQCSTPTNTPTETNTPTPTQTHSPSASPTPTKCMEGYTYTTSPGTVVPGTTLVPDSQCLTCIVSVTLPFRFTFYGQTYDDANLSNKGTLQFVAAVNPYQSCPPPYPQLGPAILPLWDSYINTNDHGSCQSVMGSPCGMYTSVSGSPPNRIFNIEWRTGYATSGSRTANFEIRLYETTSAIDFAYNRVVYDGGSASIGLQNSATEYAYYACNVWGSAHFVIVSWKPVQCEPSPTPTPGTPTGTITLQPTRTLTPITTVQPTRTYTATITNQPVGTYTPTIIPCSITFTDVEITDYFYEAVSYLYCLGVISGYADNTFRPYNNTTRAQMCKIVVLAEGWQLECPAAPTFSDVQPTNPFFCYVETAHAQGVISGYLDGTFRPGNDVTRAQLCKIVVLAEGWPLVNPPVARFRDVPEDNAFYRYIETAYSHAIISGYGCGTGCLEFRPGNSATRGQICKIVFAALER